MSFVEKEKKREGGMSVEISLRCPAMTHAKPYTSYTRLVTPEIWTLLWTLDPYTFFVFSLRFLM